MGSACAPAKKPSKGRVCVTGANGFIASHLVKMLLERGYVVHATVRSLADAEKVGHLKKMPGAPDNLRLFEADLLKEGSFAKAIAGTSCVFHTASPVFFKGATVENIVDPALKGTDNVLKACAAESSVKTVIVTASTSSVYVHDDASMDPKRVWSEKDWSDVKAMRKHNSFYPLGKTLAEKRAWDIHRDAAVSSGGEGGFRMAVMNPTVVWGPMLQAKLNVSTSWVLEYLDGTHASIPDSFRTMVDVRDVALAHLRALENPEAKGRYLLMAECLHWKDTCELLRKTQPWNEKIPTKLGPRPSAENRTFFGTPPPHTTLFDNSKAKSELKINFRSAEETLRDTVASLTKAGFAPKSNEG